MKKIALVLSLAVFTLGSVSVINSSKTFAAFPISQTTEAVATQNEAAIEEAVAQATTTTTATKVKTEKKQNFFSKMMSKLGGGKSQLAAVLICFFLGGLGIHRFYLGYTWQGVVQLLTGGGCGVWALIDFIRILIGDLGPKDGSYDKTL
jgi:TM2 domain-containing membrane protein YozV